MLVKAVLVFLGAMALLAMIGNLFFPGAIRRRLRTRRALPPARGCPRCGRPQLGRDPCACADRKAP